MSPSDVPIEQSEGVGRYQYSSLLFPDPHKHTHSSGQVPDFESDTAVAILFSTKIIYSGCPRRSSSS